MKGALFIVGIGQKPDHLTLEAIAAIKGADVIAGHELFIEQVKQFIPNGTRIISDAVLRAESADVFRLMDLRAGALLKEMLQGKNACILSGGDSGIFGVAGYCIEKILSKGDFGIHVIPGISSFLSAAALAGSPLSEGFALLSLCDEYIPEKIVFRRLELAAESDIPAVIFKPKLEAEGTRKMYPRAEYPRLYPPESVGKKRLLRLQKIFLARRGKSTPVAIVNNIGGQSCFCSEDSAQVLFGKNSSVEIIRLGQLHKKINKISFFSTLIIGNSRTVVIGNRMVNREWALRKKKK